MPKPSPDPGTDTLARDVDRLLAQLSAGGHQAPASPSPITSGSQRRITRVSSQSSTSRRRARLGLWARVALALALGAALTQWPYARECGLALAAYLFAVSVVMLAALWTAIASWVLRDGVAHALAVLLLLWGVGLAAERVLPRVGYAMQQASWGCVESTGTPAPPFGLASR